MEKAQLQKLIVIAGPTGSGKSEIAIRLARDIGGEIISVDSMQVYRGMDIGTAKVTPEQRASVPHHLIDIAPPDRDFDAGQFVRTAGPAISRIISRNKVPIICGGTGLYLKALFCGIGTAPPADPDIRAELECLPLEILQSQLKSLSPATWNSIDVQNKRRVVRALEIARLTGRAPVDTWSPWESTAESWPEMTFVIQRDVDELRQALDRRVDTMIDLGLVEETRKLIDLGLCRNTTARQAIGYRQTIDHILRNIPLDSTIEEIKLRTRQYAKRQRTWFRNQMPSIPVPLKERDVDSAVEFIRDRLSDFSNHQESCRHPNI